MGATRRLCVRAVVLAGLMSPLFSSALTACQFPNYAVATGGGGGSAGAASGGMSGSMGGVPAEAGEGGDVSGAGGESGESGSSGQAGSGGSAGGTELGGAAGAEQPATCPPQGCVAIPPMNWKGPMALWEGATGTALPDCPEGYRTLADLHREPTAPPPQSQCSCTCAAQGQVCQSTLRVYDDQACEKPCTTASAQLCSSVSGCIGSQGSMRCDNPTLSGGSCSAKLGPIPPATWLYDARLCEASAGTCDDSSQVCAPLPSFPYLTQLCITRRVSEGPEPLPACPAEYQSVRRVYYETFNDTRGCTDCGCSGPTGGSCTGKLAIMSGSDCSSQGDECPLDGSCTPFNVGPGSNVRPTHVAGRYNITAGSCAVAIQPMATGKVSPNGNATVVCCQ